MHVHFSSRRTRRTFAITSVRVIPSFSSLSLPSEFASYEFFLPSLDFKIIPLPPPPSWLQSGKMKRETFLHDAEKHCPLLFLRDGRGELSKNVTRSTSPRFGIFMRRFVYWISLLVYRVKLEIGVRGGWEAGKFLLKDY